MSKHIKVRWRGLKARRAAWIAKCERKTGTRPATISQAKVNMGLKKGRER